MDFKKIQPPENLRRYVNYFWTASGEALTYRQLLFADSRCKLVFARKGILSHHCGITLVHGRRPLTIEEIDKSLNAATVCKSNAILIGPSMELTILRNIGELDVFGVDLTDAGCHILLQIDVGEYFGRSVAVQNTDNPYLSAILQQVTLSKSADDCVSGIITALSEHVNTYERDLHSVDIIDALSANINKVHDIAEILDTLGISERTLNRLMHKYVGLSAKDFLLIKRFNKALSDICGIEDEYLWELAIDDYYYDKSHMVKEFRRFCGHSPGSLRQHIKSMRNINGVVQAYCDGGNFDYFVV